MRICCLIDCYLPSPKSGAKLMADLAEEFARFGHDVLVVTPSDEIDSNLDVTQQSSVQVCRIRTGKLKGVPKPIRALREIRLSPVLWRRGRRFFQDHPCDLIVSYSPSIFFGPLVEKLKSLWDAKHYLILRDIFPQWALDMGILKPGFVARIFQQFERKQYQQADVIGVQSPANLEYFHENPHLAGNAKLDVLLNWMSLEQSHESTSLRKTLGLESKTVFFYGGNIGLAQHMDTLVTLAKNTMDREDIFYLLLGEGSEVARLKQSISKLGLKNICIEPALPQEQYLGAVSEFDVGLICLDANLKTHNIPGKLLGYLYWGLPTLASINPDNDLQQILQGSQAGLVSLTGDDESLKNNALKLADNVQLRRDMSQQARRLLKEKFSTQKAANQILAAFEDKD